MFSLTGAKIRGTLSKKKASPSLRVGKTLNVRDGGGAATLRSNQGEKPLTGREGERNHVRNFLHRNLGGSATNSLSHPAYVPRRIIDQCSRVLPPSINGICSAINEHSYILTKLMNKQTPSPVLSYILLSSHLRGHARELLLFKHQHPQILVCGQAFEKMSVRPSALPR